MMPVNSAVRTALISVSDKQGVVDFARSLELQGVKILSTGGTSKLLGEAGITVTDVSDHTGFDEIMDGRVKTLHPVIHGGILGRRGVDDAVMEANGITPIDMVVVNLYPFEKTTRSADCTLETAIDNIDIGGPAMLRAAAKNHAHVTVVVNSSDYSVVLGSMEKNDGAVDQDTRFQLASRAFAHTARYDGLIANYLGCRHGEGAPAVFSQTWNAQFEKKQDMRYGENPHQAAAFYISTDTSAEANVSQAHQIQGKALSYNNIADTDAALECVKQFGPSGDQSEGTCVIVKHANPCGVAVASDLSQAYAKAFNTDPESAFGGIIAFNQTLTADVAREIVDKQFVEVIISPEVTDEAVQVLAEKENIRLLTCGHWSNCSDFMDFKRVSGGLLLQQGDTDLCGDIKVVTRRQPSEEEMENLLFAWKVAKFVKSNAIVYARDKMTYGVGAGQMSRVNSARIAAIKAEHAGLSVKGAVMASDAFFPFRDGLDNAASAGITAVIQPGGSMRDEEVIEAADEHGIAMIYTGMRHFRH